MKIKSDELKLYLDDLGHCAVDNMTQVENSDCVTFMGGKAYTFSTLGLVISNLDLDIRGMVRYSDFSDVVDKYYKLYRDEELEITRQDDARMSIRRGRSRTMLPCPMNVSLKAFRLPNIIEEDWKPLPDGFFKKISACEAVFPRNLTSDKVSSCLNITPTCVEALSAAMAVRCFWDLDIPCRFLIKNGRLSTVKLSHTKEYQLCQQWFCLRSDRSTFCVPVFRDVYADLDRYLKSGRYSVVFPPEASHDVQLLSKFIKGKGKSGLLYVEFCGSFCRISGTSGSGRHEVEVPMQCPDDYRFWVTPDSFEHLVSFGNCVFGEDAVYCSNDGMTCAVSIEREDRYAI